MTKPPVRRRSATSTRSRILKAAQIAFSEAGYSQTGIRKIGAMAGTTGTMLGRYFGSKAKLFELALIDAMQVDRMLAQDRKNLGALLASSILNPDADIRSPLMIAMAADDPEAREIAARVVEDELIVPLSKWLGGSDTSGRALAMIMLATGFITYMKQVPLRPMSEAERSYLIAWFTEGIQLLVNG